MTKKPDTTLMRMYRAWIKGDGVRLSVDDLDAIFTTDDAIGTRLTNEIAYVYGLDEARASSVLVGMTIRDIVKDLAAKEGT